jgi:hypothetical protein
VFNLSAPANQSFFARHIVFNITGEADHMCLRTFFGDLVLRVNNARLLRSLSRDRHQSGSSS